jgi:hypothetical protein
MIRNPEYEFYGTLFVTEYSTHDSGVRYASTSANQLISINVHMVIVGLTYSDIM